jgi:hypothetical protein
MMEDGKNKKERGPPTRSFLFSLVKLFALTRKIEKIANVKNLKKIYG